MIKLKIMQHSFGSYVNLNEVNLSEMPNSQMPLGTIQILLPHSHERHENGGDLLLAAHYKEK